MPKNNPHFVDSFISYQGKQDDELLSQIRNDSNNNHLKQCEISNSLFIMNDRSYDNNFHQNYNENSSFNEDSGQNLNSYNNRSLTLKYAHYYENQAQNPALNQSEYDYGVANNEQFHNQYHKNQINLQNYDICINRNDNKPKFQEKQNSIFQQQHQEYKILPDLGYINTLNININNNQKNRAYLENSSNFKINARVESFFNENNGNKNNIDNFLESSSNNDVNYYIDYFTIYMHSDRRHPEN